MILNIWFAGLMLWAFQRRIVAHREYRRYEVIVQERYMMGLTHAAHSAAEESWRELEARTYADMAIVTCGVFLAGRIGGMW